MPPLSSRLGNSLPGYSEQEKSPAAVPVVLDPGRPLGGNAFIRSPLPPFNSSPDSLRQFNESGKIPTRRVIPLPQSVVAGGTTTITNNTTITESSSSGSSSSPSTITAKTVSIAAGTLAPGNIATVTVTAAKAGILMILGSSDLCEVRLYGDPVTQISDTGRVTDSAPAFEILPGLISDVVLDTTPLQWHWQNRVFVNQDSPQTQNLYISILNNTLGSVTPTITITYLPLE